MKFLIVFLCVIVFVMALPTERVSWNQDDDAVPYPGLPGNYVANFLSNVFIIGKEEEPMQDNNDEEANNTANEDVDSDPQLS